MGIEQIDRALLKEILKEVLLEKKSLFKELVQEILEENQIISSSEQSDRRDKLKALINEDFDRFDDVFKALS